MRCRDNEASRACDRRMERTRTFLFVLASVAGSRLSRLAPDLVDALSSSSSSSSSSNSSSETGRAIRAGDGSRAADDVGVIFARMTGPSLGDIGELVLAPVLALVMLLVETLWMLSTLVGGECAMAGESVGGEA